eukprot:g16462.t1
MTSLLTFCFDVITVDTLLSGEKYTKAEMPVVLVTTPSSLLALVKQRQAKGTMRPLAETLKILILDEADLMFSFGYEEDVKSLCALMPPQYQAILVSATLSEEVQQLKGLMLHKPVVLKLEEPRVTGKLSQFYFICHKTDKLERFSINSAVLNSELPHASRQNILDTFNQGLVELLIATDEGLGGNQAIEEEEDEAELTSMDVQETAVKLEASGPRRSALRTSKTKDAEERVATPTCQAEEDEEVEEEEEEEEEEEDGEEVEEKATEQNQKGKQEERGQTAIVGDEDIGF